MNACLMLVVEPSFQCDCMDTSIMMLTTYLHVRLSSCGSAVVHADTMRAPLTRAMRAMSSSGRVEVPAVGAWGDLAHSSRVVRMGDYVEVSELL